MLSRLLKAYRRLDLNRQVEESVAARLLVWAATEASLLALWRQGALSGSAFLLSTLGIAGGSLFSWARRRSDNWWSKLLISLGLVYLLIFFLREVSAAYYDLRFPLATLFLWLQVLHSFDQPGRRDLMLSLISSLVLLALAGSFSLDTAFLLYVIIYLAVAVPALIALEDSRMREGSLVASTAGKDPAPAGRRLRSMGRRAAFHAAAMLALAVALTLSLPQQFNYANILPFSPLRLHFRGGLKGLHRPGYGMLPSRLPDNPLPVDPEVYYGISDFLDLRVRGELSDTVLMRVKSTHPAYWRGVAFDLYRGVGWERSSEEASDLYPINSVFSVPPDTLPTGGEKERCIQTFYIEREMPNAVLAAYRPLTLFFPSTQLSLDDYLSMRSPFLLDLGLTYSVVSELPRPDPEALRAAPEAVRGVETERYLQLPEISDRLKGLVQELTSGLESPYERALALQGHLMREYSYSLVPPPQDPREDAVEFLLFGSKQGNCEHFASALALTCRIAGIPSRVAAGFATGDFNPFSGLYEVRARDAHAWVELYFQGLGWVPFEATPGFSMPSGRRDPLLGLLDAFKWLGRRLKGLLPSWTRKGLAAGAKAVGAFLSGLAGAAWRHPLPGVLTVLAVLGLPPTLLWRRRRRRVKTGKRVSADEPRNRVVAEFLGLLGDLEAWGWGRKPSATPREHLGGLAFMMALPGWEPLVETFYRARYGEGDIDDREAERFLASLRSFKESAREAIDGAGGGARSRRGRRERRLRATGHD